MMKYRNYIANLLLTIFLFISGVSLAEKPALPDVPESEVEVYYQGLFQAAEEKFGDKLTEAERYAVGFIHDDIAAHSVAAEDHDFMKYEILGLDSVEALKAFINNGLFGDKLSKEKEEELLQKTDELIAAFSSSKRKYTSFHIRDDAETALGRIQLEDDTILTMVILMDGMRVEMVQFEPGFIKSMHGEKTKASEEQILQIKEACKAMILKMGQTPFDKWEPLTLKSDIMHFQDKQVVHALFKYLEKGGSASSIYHEAKFIYDLKNDKFIALYDDEGAERMYLLEEYPI